MRQRRNAKARHEKYEMKESNEKQYQYVNRKYQ